MGLLTNKTATHISENTWTKKAWKVNRRLFYAQTMAMMYKCYKITIFKQNHTLCSHEYIIDKIVSQLTLGNTRTRKCQVKRQYGHHRFRQVVSDNLKRLLWSNCLQRNLFISRIEEQQCYRLLITSFVFNINKRPSDHIVVAGLSVCYCIQMIIPVDLNVAFGICDTLLEIFEIY